MNCHGVVFDGSDQQGSVRFGFLKCLRTLADYYGPVGAPGVPARPIWPALWLDAGFFHAVRKYEDTFLKFNRAASHLDRCVDTLKRNHPLGESANVLEVISAVDDAPLYLDLLILYLRVQADCIARVVPNLYGQEGRRRDIARGSFRGHARWFRGRVPEFDSTYAEILSGNLGWFQTLAGGTHGEGLRNLVVHRSGVYQLAQSTDTDGGDFRLHAAIVAEGAAMSGDVVLEIQSIVNGYCAYLDATLAHFLEIITKRGGPQLMERGPDDSEVYRFEGGTSTEWVYPVITRAVGESAA